MTDLFEKSIQTLELPRVLELLSAQAVTEEGKERCRALRPEGDLEEVAHRLKETSAAVDRMKNVYGCRPEDIRTEITGGGRRNEK